MYIQSNTDELSDLCILTALRQQQLLINCVHGSCLFVIVCLFVCYCLFVVAVVVQNYAHIIEYYYYY
jgi:hypothetical protein